MVDADFQCPEAARPFVLAATIAASAMAFIDGSVVSIALPTIQRDLAADFTVLQWVVNSYHLFLGALILVGGAAGDRFGRRRIFLAGLVVFAAASALCALAPDTLCLVLARALQGFGAALLVPQSLAIIAASFPKEVRGRAIGLWAGASAITTALGPPLGGLMIDALDWRAVFWLNLPFCAVAIGLTVRFVPESRNQSVSGPLDWPGGLLAILALGLLTVGLTRLSEGGDGAGAGALLGFGVLALIAFLLVEARAADPLMPLGLFRNASFSAANALTLFLYGALGGILFLLPFDLIARRGLSASAVGLTMLPLGLIIGLLSRPAGDLADRLGTKPLLTVGALLVAGAAAGLALGLEAFWLGIMGPIVMISAGMALVVAPLTTAVMNAAGDERSGAASGVNNAASRLAGLLAIAFLGAVASLAFSASLEGAGLVSDGYRFGVLPEPLSPDRAAAEDAFLDAYGLALWLASSFGILSAVIAWTSLPKDRPAAP